VYGWLFWKESGCPETMKDATSYWLWRVGILLPPVILVCIILSFSVNVPWFDDFEPFPDFLNNWLKAKGASDHLGLIFKANNEHRMVFGKLATLLIYWGFSTLNFTYLHLVGFAFTLGTFGLFYKICKENGFTNKEFVPVSWLLFQWQYQLVFLWAICSLQHQPVVFFLCLSMYLLANMQSTWTFVWAIFFGFCANFSMSNGLFVWIAGAVVLVYQRAFLKLPIWLAFSVIAIMAYFHGLTTMGNEQSFAYLQNHPDETFFGFFTFLGGLFDLFPDRPIDFRVKLPIVGGMLMTILGLFWLWKIGRRWILGFKTKAGIKNHVSPKYKGTLPAFLLGVLGFLISNAAVIALLRPRFGFLVMLVSNYKLYPALYMMVIYSAILNLVSVRYRPMVWRIGMVVSIGIWLISILQYGPMMAERRKDYYVDAFNQQHNGFGLGHQPNSAETKYVTALMKELEIAQIYAYPAAYSPYFDLIRLANVKSGIEASVSVLDSANMLLITAPHTPTWGMNDGVYVFLRSSKQLYVFKMVQQIYTGRNFLKHYENVVSIQVPLNAISSDSYQLGFMVIDGNKTDIGIYKSIKIEQNDQ